MDTFFYSESPKLGLLAARYAVPTIGSLRSFTAAGGLINFNGNVRDIQRQVAIYTGRILKGEKPADLPVILPTKYDLVINLNAAKGAWSRRAAGSVRPGRRGDRMKATRTVSKRSRRQFLHLAATASALPAVSHLALAQTYPSRPVNLIVFVPAGGNPDIIARLFAQALSQRLGQSVIIDNRPGGGGNLALQAVARAPADGHTLLLAASPHAINATLYEKSTITITRDIAPVASISNDFFRFARGSVIRGQNSSRVYCLC